MFDNKYMKFDARSNAICTFGLNIKYSASNIDFSVILERSSYIVLLPWCVKPLTFVLDLVYLLSEALRRYIGQVP